MSIGQRLKEARKARSMSQDMLADKIGASRGVITNIEHDKVSEPQPMVINAICSVLNINKEWLTDGIGSMDISKKQLAALKFFLKSTHVRKTYQRKNSFLFLI